jgi:hypothetical protein
MSEGNRYGFFPRIAAENAPVTKSPANTSNRKCAQLTLATEIKKSEKTISTLENILGCILVEHLTGNDERGIVFMSHTTDIDGNSKEEIEQLLEECKKYYRREIRTT